MRTSRIACAAALWAAVSAGGCSSTRQPDHAAGGNGVEAVPQPAAAIHPDWRGVPLGATIDKGLAWLAAAQGADGGYGQDGRDPRTGVGLEAQGHDVANTAMAALAMLRTGTTPTDGTYSDHLLAAVDFILGHIEAAPEEGLAITDRQGTQIQRKLGRYVDTFLSAMLLAELKGHMPDARSEQRVCAALEKCVAKIEKNQQHDGSWNSGGWAPIISTSLASRSLDRAMSKGVDVDREVLSRVDAYTAGQFDDKARAFKSGSTDAGVALYSVAQAYEQASRSEQSAADNKDLIAAAETLMGSARFQAGFGSMGGEEFISYMNLSDSLRRSGGEKWTTWNGEIVERLASLQNGDGSWAGHHCITGRVACTAAAVLTLASERVAPRPAGD